MRRLLSLVSLLLLAACAGPGVQPTDSACVHLLVAPGPEARQFDYYSLADLEALGLEEVATDTGDVYQGPLLADVLRDAGIDSVGTLAVHALDGYYTEIPRADWETWPVLLATRRDGAPMAAPDKGPLRLVYPTARYPALRAEAYRSRAVWSVSAIRPLD